jgi:glycosyltransferase involved in cell wall biosynthesis
MDASIVIGTFNRCYSLMKSVQSVLNMNVPDGIAWELIVVDNNSGDKTRELIEALKVESKADIKYILEKRQGLSYARNRGIEESKGGIVAFLDDDCIVDPHWLERLVHEFRSDPELSGIGGRVELFDVRDKPVTIMTSRERRLFSSAGQLFSFIHGCNMAFCRKVFQEIGCFDFRLGPGTKVFAAEDADFIYRVYKSGFRMLYCPDLCVYHNHGRRLDAQVSALLKGYALGRGAFYCKHIVTGDSMLLKMAYWEISALLKTVIRGSSGGKTRQDLLTFVWNMFVGGLRYIAIFRRAGTAFHTSSHGSLHKYAAEQQQQPLLGRARLNMPGIQVKNHLD